MPVGQYGEEHSIATCAARGNNHAHAAKAIARVLALGLLGAVPLPAALTAPAWAQATAEGDPLVQRGVPAEATAENAVVARDRALASGQRVAYERMAAQLGLPRGIPDSQIDGLVSSLVIESERITARGYSARITVNFNPQRVAAGGATPAPGAAAAGRPAGPAVATVEALASYRSLPEWVEITRRLNSAPAVARMEVVTISGEMARLRLGLRSQPPEAAAELAQGGLLLGPATPPGMPVDPRLGESWRLVLAGTR